MSWRAVWLSTRACAVDWCSHLCLDKGSLHAGGVGQELLDFAARTDNFDSTLAAEGRSGWVDDGNSACNWAGVTCNGNGTVTGLNVSSWGLSGAHQSHLPLYRCKCLPS